MIPMQRPDGSQPRPGTDAAAAAAAASRSSGTHDRDRFPTVSASTHGPVIPWSPMRAPPRVSLHVDGDGRGEATLTPRQTQQAQTQGHDRVRQRYFVDQPPQSEQSARIQVIESPSVEAAAAAHSASPSLDARGPPPLRSTRSAFEPPAAAARNTNAQNLVAAPMHSAVDARNLVEPALGDGASALLESAVSEEVSALEGCKLSDTRSLETCAHRLQQLAARWKQQQQQGSGGAGWPDPSAAAQLKRDSARIFKWISQNKSKMAKAADLHAASKATTSDRTSMMARLLQSLISVVLCAAVLVSVSPLRGCRSVLAASLCSACKAVREYE